MENERNAVEGAVCLLFEELYLSRVLAITRYERDYFDELIDRLSSVTKVIIECAKIRSMKEPTNGK